MRTSALSLAALLAAFPAGVSPAAAQTIGMVSRGEIPQVLIRVKGSVQPEDVVRLNSTIEGRVEEIEIASMSWVHRGEPLAYILNKEMAAMLDSKGSTPWQVVEQRWQFVYKATPIECSTDCFVLRVFAQKKAWIQPDSLLFEVARQLRLVGRVRPQDSRWIHPGQTLTFWDVKNPKRRLETTVGRLTVDWQREADPFATDWQAGKTESGGTLIAPLSSTAYLDPGTQWEGLVSAKGKRDTLRVPTQALLSYQGEVFLPIRVSTGITSNDVTEITGGVSTKDVFLILTPSTGTCAGKYAPAPHPAEELPAEPSAQTERPRRQREESSPPPLREESAPPRHREKVKINSTPEEKPDEPDDEFPSDLHRGSPYE